MKTTINSRQTGILCFVMLFSIKLLTLPSLIYSDVKLDALIVFVILLGLDVGVLFIFLYLKKKYNNMKILDIFNIIFGKILAKIILFIFFVFFMAKLLYLLNESFSFFRSSLFDQASIFIFLFCIFPIINALAFSNTRAFARTVEFFFYFIVIILGISIFLSFGQANDFSMSPLFDNSLGEILKSSLSKTMWFGDYIFLFFFIDKIEIKNKTDRKKIISFVLLGILILLIFVYMFYRLLLNTSPLYYRALYDISQFTSKNVSIGKLDIFPIATMMFIVIFQGAVYLFCSNYCLDKIWKKSIINPIFINIALIITMLTIIPNCAILIEYFTRYFKYFTAVLIYVIPLTLLFVTMLKKKVQKK